MKKLKPSQLHINSRRYSLRVKRTKTHMDVAILYGILGEDKQGKPLHQAKKGFTLTSNLKKARPLCFIDYVSYKDEGKIRFVGKHSFTPEELEGLAAIGYKTLFQLRLLCTHLIKSTPSL